MSESDYFTLTFFGKRYTIARTVPGYRTQAIVGMACMIVYGIWNLIAHRDWMRP